MLDVSEVKIFKSRLVSDDAASNGGTPNFLAEVVSGQLYNVFPRVTYAERVTGITRYRKIFIGFRVSRASETLFNLVVSPLAHTGGSDHFYAFTVDTFDELQSDLPALNALPLNGPCKTNAATATSTSIVVTAESDSLWFQHGQLCAIASDTNLMNLFFVRTINAPLETSYSVTTPSTTLVSLSVSFAAGYPQWIEAGTLSLTYTIGGTAYYVHDSITRDATAGLSGPHIVSSSVNYSTGVVTVQFDTALDNGSVVDLHAYQRCFTNLGSSFTIHFQEGLLRSVSDNEWFAGCFDFGDVYPDASLIAKASASGTISSWSVDYSDAVIYDDLILTSLGGLSFSYSTTSGSATSGSFSVTSDIELYLYSTTHYAIKFPQSAFQGSFNAGDSFTFRLYPAAVPVWIVEEVPAGIGRAPSNVLTLALIFE